VASEKFLFAMPETTIGLFPDVGGGYFLTRLPGALGTFLALTSHRLKVADALWAGIVDAHVPSALMKRPAGRPGRCRFVRPRRRPQGRRGDRPLRCGCRLAEPADLMLDIDRCFSADSVAEIVASLKKHPGEWAQKQLAALMKLSPLSMSITLEQLKRCANRSFEDTMTIEYRMSQQAMRADHDFFEGVPGAPDRQGPEAEMEPAEHRGRDGVTWSSTFQASVERPVLRLIGTRRRTTWRRSPSSVLGNMGGPMAANLAKAQHQVTAFDLSSSAVDAAVKRAPTRPRPPRKR